MFTKDGFHKALEQKLGDDAYLLLAAGGHKKLADLLTNASLGASGNSTTLSITVGGTTKTGSVTVPYATFAGTWETERILTIGSSGKSVNGSKNVTWSLAEIGAAAAGHNHDDKYLKLTGGTLTGSVTCTTSGANLIWGNITIYGGGSNGGINSLLVGDDVTIGDCNLGGIMGMKSTGTNAGFKFFNSSGTSIGGVQSTNGTLQWQNSSGTFYNIWHAGNLTKVSQLTNDSGYITGSGRSAESKLSDFLRTPVTVTSRITSLNNLMADNITAGTGRSIMRLDMVTTSITDTSAPPALSGSNSSGYLLSFSWERNTFDSITTQLYLPNGDHVTTRYGEQTLMYRGNDNGTWSSWYKLVSARSGSVGSATQPVYIDANGFATACTSYANASVNYATSAGSVAWGNVTGKPSTFTPSSHTHDDRYYTESESDSRFVNVSGDTMTGALTIKGITDTGQYSQGGFNKAYANIILQGDNTYGVSGIVFKSMKANDTNINTPSDVAFIQYHPMGVTAAAYNTTPTEASSGERSRLVIGIGNDADNGSGTVGEELWLQTAGANDLKHYVVNAGYIILDANNYTSYTVTKTGNGASGMWGINVSGSAGSVAWGNVTGKPSTFTPSSHTHSYLPLSGGTMTGNIVLSNATIIQNQASTSNYTTPITWYKGGVSQGTYNPQIGQHNTGGDGSGSICILPYTTSTSPWGGTVGLFIQKGLAKLDNNTLIHSGNIGSQSVNYATTAGTISGNFVFTDSDVPEGAANLSTAATVHSARFYRNGILFPYQMDNTNDGGMIRVRGKSESDCILEIATWDDSGGGETIQFNYYPTTSQISPTYSVSVPKKSGTIALTNDLTWSNISGKPSTFTPSSHTHDYLPLSGGTMTGNITAVSTASSWIDGQRYNRGIRFKDATDTGSYWPWLNQTNTGSGRWFSLGVLGNSLYIIGSATSRTSNGYDYGWRFDLSNGWAYGNFQNADTVDGYHASGLFEVLSFSGSTLTVKIGGTQKTCTISTGSTVTKSTSCSSNRYVVGTDSTSGNFTTAYCCAQFYFTTSGAYHTSDIRKKYDIRDIYTDEVTRLFNTDNAFIRHFKWKDTNHDAYGFIAQELAEYCPEAVDLNNDTGYYAVNYNVAFSKIIGAMYKEIKHLREEVKILKGEA